jgi:hypothetical protein
LDELDLLVLLIQPIAHLFYVFLLRSYLPEQSIHEDLLLSELVLLIFGMAI